MSACNGLPTKDDLDKLKREIEGLKREIKLLKSIIEKLKDKFIPKSDRKKIIRDGGLAGKALVLPLLGSLGIAEMAQLRARIFKVQSQVIKVDAKAAKAVKSSGQAFKASSLATKNAGKALGGAAKARRTAESAFGSASKAGKVAKKAGEIATTASKGVTKLAPLLKLIPVLTSLLALAAAAAVLVVLGKRIDSVERGQDRLSNDVSKNLTFIGQLKSQIERLTTQLLQQQRENEKARDDAYRSLRYSIKNNENISNLWKHISGLTRGSKESLKRIGLLEDSNEDLNKFKKNINYTAQLGLERATEALINSEKALKFKAVPGVDGKPGRDGRDGRDGRPGRDGINGLNGAPGRNGTNGTNGRDGARGIPGATGATGARGLTGAPGAPGRDGAPGRNGTDGKQGPRGFPGIPGAPGRDGLNGLNGKDGLNGINGRNGRDLVPDAQMKAQMNRIEAQSKANSNAIKSATKGISNNGNGINNNGKGIKANGDAIKEKFDKLSRRLKLPELINGLTLIVALHNAAMLSKNLLETLGDIASLALSLIGFKDENGQPHDINAVLGKTVTDLLKGLLGESVWNNTVLKWKAANRVYQATANIIDTARSIGNSTRVIAEIAAENTGKIGNALKRDRVIAEDAFPWMAERVTPQFAWTQKLDNLDDAASALSTVLSEVNSIQESAKELKDQKDELDKSLTEAEPLIRANNEPVSTTRNTQLSNSKATPIEAGMNTGKGETDANP